MRDPDLVQRAERAAGALERAWDHWRTMHGLGSEPLAPVSSYVGYSMDEPWGQPRVVFGVAADEAELLAAVLDGHDCYGPVHAEVSGKPDWRHLPVSDAGSSARSLDDNLNIPHQARPPALDMLPSANADYSAPYRDANVIEPNAPDARIWDQADRPDANLRPPLTELGSAKADDKRVPDGRAELVDAEDADALPEISPEELPPLPPMPDPSPTGPMGSASLAPKRPRNKDAQATPGPGYRGPRYQGTPRRYKVTREAAERASAEVADAIAVAAATDSSDAAIAPPNAAALETTAVPHVADAHAFVSAPVVEDAVVAPEDTVDPDAALAAKAAAVDDDAGPAATISPDIEDAADAPDAGVTADTPQAEVANADAVASRPASRPARARPHPPSKVSSGSKVSPSSKVSPGSKVSPVAAKASSVSKVGPGASKMSPASKVTSATKASPAPKSNRTQRQGPATRKTWESAGDDPDTAE